MRFECDSHRQLAAAAEGESFTAAIVGLGDVSKRRNTSGRAARALSRQLRRTSSSRVISAPATNARPAPVRDHASDVRVVASGVDGDYPARRSPIVERVELVRSVDRDRRDAVGYGEGNVS
jgi:hypothetical protein